MRFIQNVAVCGARFGGGCAGGINDRQCRLWFRWGLWIGIWFRFILRIDNLFLQRGHDGRIAGAAGFAALNRLRLMTARV